MTTFSSREFNQDLGKAKRAAAQGPVVVTDRGRPTHVLMTFDHYEALRARAPKTTKLLGMAEDIEFDIPELREHPAPPDLS